MRRLKTETLDHGCCSVHCGNPESRVTAWQLTLSHESDMNYEAHRDNALVKYRCLVRNRVRGQGQQLCRILYILRRVCG